MGEKEREARGRERNRLVDDAPVPGLIRIPALPHPCNLTFRDLTPKSKAAQLLLASLVTMTGPGQAGCKVPVSTQVLISRVLLAIFPYIFF